MQNNFIQTQIKLIFMWMKIDFGYEMISTKTRFEKEAWGNSEMGPALSHELCGNKLNKDNHKLWIIIVDVLAFVNN